jgi:ellis van creveld syndrome protein 2
VAGQSEPQTVQVQLLVNNTKTPGAANLSDLLLLDAITGLTIKEFVGNKTPDGFQAFGKKFLEGNSTMFIDWEWQVMKISQEPAG